MKDKQLVALSTEGVELISTTKIIAHNTLDNVSSRGLSAVWKFFFTSIICLNNPFQLPEQSP